MTGNIWMCSHLLNTEDLEFGMHEFITYKIPDDEDDICLLYTSPSPRDRG